MRMGSTTKTRIVSATPIDGIQFALVARLGPVGNLVIDVPGCDENVVDCVVLVGLIIVVGMTGRIIGKRFRPPR